MLKMRSELQAGAKLGGKTQQAEAGDSEILICCACQQRRDPGWQEKRKCVQCWERARQVEKAKQAKELEEKKYLPPGGKRRSKACRFLEEGTCEAQTSIKAPS